MARTKVKTAGFMVNFQDQLDNMMSGLKAIEEDFDEALQKLLIKSSGQIQLSKKLEEISLIVEFMKTQNSSENEEEIKNLVKAIKRKFYECIELLMCQIHKSMMRAVESLSEAQEGIVMADKIHKLMKSLVRLERVIEE
ncbi:hypothetical protein SAMN05660826_01454 [Caldanaerovirga acetigignens]|uniref:Uncharacterized protein n=1 Tax=Caldanaerovirga acetigignens TaxID=447595 RepID=A0A1M7K7M6_9FIRM|nr:hypothetical protein [Caldanaerovirga acetigignens]SHM61309.1 hypothetical protein SAMN05660826_01454 [Caldanaerovirga acetigignens]